jgi:regulator of replication initiation timing
MPEKLTPEGERDFRKGCGSDTCGFTDDGYAAIWATLDAARAECERLKEDCHDLGDVIEALSEESERLKAENKVLREGTAYSEYEAEIARMRPVVEAAMAYESNPNLESDATFIDLINAVIAYRAHPSPRDEEGK